MDRDFTRKLIGFIAENPKAGEVFNNTIRSVGELTARGRKPSEKELDALTSYVIARAEADAPKGEPVEEAA